jgi:hypothetical protein
MVWKHDSGGCKVGSTDPNPCDDTYVEETTGKRVTFKTTVAAHHSLPAYVADIRFVRAMPGVVMSDTTLEDQPPVEDESSDDPLSNIDWGSLIDDDED